MTRSGKISLLTGLVLIISASISPTAFADSHGKGMHGGQSVHQSMHKGGGHGGCKMGRGGQGQHIFSDPWKATLTKEQRIKIDGMHLELKKKQARLKAQKKLKKTELKLLLIQDKPARKAIDKKIDEIVELKRKKMKNRYQHVLSMRQALTKQQRITFDLGLLGKHEDRGKRKH